MKPNKDTIHYGVEILAFIGVTVYFTHENSKLKKEIAQLKEETTALAKYIKMVELKLGTNINQIMSAHHPTTPRSSRRKRSNSVPNINRPRPRPQVPAYNEDLEDEYISSEETLEESYEEEPRKRKFQPTQPPVINESEKKRSFRPRNSPERSKSLEPRIEEIEDEDLLNDLEDVANSDEIPRSSRQEVEGRPVGVSKNKERMTRTKEIAAQMQARRKERIKAEQERKA